MQTIDQRLADKPAGKKSITDKPAGDRNAVRHDTSAARPQAARPYLYFAYGSNLNQEQMGWRCPTAQPVSRLTLPDWRLEFRGVADIVPCLGAEVVGALYSICPGDEMALDRYEGFQRQTPNAGMYRKVFWPTQDKHGRKRTVMFYVMNRVGLWPPYEGYLKTIQQGYADWALPPTSLDAAVQRSCPDGWGREYEQNQHEQNDVWASQDALTGDLFNEDWNFDEDWNV